MKFKAILFDMDGVLTDSFGSCFTAFNFALEHFGKKPITKEEYMKNCWGTPVDDDLRLYLGECANIKQASEFYHSNYVRFIEHSRVFPGVVEVLKFVKNNGLKTAVVTNTHRELTLKILKKFNLLNYFDAVFGGDDVKAGKPDPEIVIKACSALGVLPKNAAMVGDTNADMNAGKNAGCFTVGVGVDGDVKIKNLSELLKHLG
jgi:HAD superfamily hydrolase (TIGR01509 family)